MVHPYTLLILAAIALQISQHILLVTLSTILGFICMVIGLLKLKGLARYISLLLVIISIIILLINHVPFMQLASYMVKKIEVVLLIIILPVLGFPIHFGDYSKIFIRLKSNGLYLHLISFLLGSFISLGSIPILSTLLESKKPEVQRETSTILRGINLGILWSPLSATFALAITFTGSSWINAGPPAFIFALGCVLFSSHLLYGETKWAEKSNTMAIHANNYYNKDNKYLIIGITFSSILLVSLNIYTSISMIRLLIFFCPLFCLVWALLANKIVPVTLMLHRYLFSDISTNHFVFGGFISAGFLTSTLEFVFLKNPISLENMAPPWLILMVLPVLPFVLSIIGIHPLVSIMLFASIINIPSIPGSLTALAFSGGAVLGVMTSPFGIIVQSLSSSIKNNPFVVGLQWNISFALILLGILCLYLYGLFKILYIFS